MNDIKATVPSYDQIYANYMYYLSLTGIQEYPWYETANEYLREVAEFLRVDFETVVYTTASLAVRIKWINKLVNGTIKYPNIDAAVRMIYGVLTGRDYDDIVKGIAVYDANRQKAYKIAQTGEGDAILGGKKLRAFAANILNPNGVEITADTWVYRAGLLKPNLLQNDVSPYFNYNEQFIAPIKDIAERYGLIPNHVQALIWIGVQFDSDLKGTLKEIDLSL
jgi:hypothetical protein